MSDDNKKPEKLTIGEQKFVKALATETNSAKEALLLADYKPTSEKSAQNMAFEIMQRPRVQNALAKALQERYPDVANEAADTLIEIMRDIDLNPLIRIKAIEQMSKTFGWVAPTKHASVHVGFKDKFALPGGEDNE